MAGLRLGSLFDGSGGFPLAGVINGIEPVWSSEIEPYPMRVTAARFPQVKQLGDVTKINGAEIEPVDIITFGSPCQDLSVAGKQAGIHDGQRSNLFFEAIRIIKEMRHRDEFDGRTGIDVRPRFAVWENVPGAFSSNKGEDFRAVIEAFAGVCEDGLDIPRPKRGKWSHAGGVAGDGWSLAWRVYDAQYWGVPQRRKRIYLIADFGAKRADKILFERESVSGHPETGREAGQGTAADAERGVGGSDSVKNQNYLCYPDKAMTLTARHDSSPCVDRGQNVVCVQNTGQGWWNEGEVAQTLRTPCGGDSTKANLIIAPNGNYCGDYEEADVYATLNTGYHFGSGGDAALVCYDARGNGDGTTAPTITGDHENRVTDYTAVAVGNGQMHQTDLGDKTGALNCMHDQQAVIHDAPPPRKYIIRRLTPLECCRLQGFPDWWVDGVDGSDSAQYKMWGNGIALPCAVDVLRRIAEAVE